MWHNVLFHLVCVAWLGLALLVWEGGGRRWPVPHTPSQPANPASNTHTNVFAFVCLLLFHIYILYMLHITQTDRQTDIDRSIDLCLFSLSLSLSLYIVLVLVACTLSHHHHTTRAVRVYVCVCIWLPFEQCFRHPDNRPHNDIICRGQTTGAHRHHSNAPRHALLGAGHGVLCVCIGVSCCEAAVRGGRVEIRAVPPPARPLAATRAAGRQACRRQARTFPPCCCCNNHNERLRNAHFIRCPPLVRCSSLARPPSPTPHTAHMYIVCIYIHNRTHHTGRRRQPPPPAPPAEKKKSTHYICVL
jgi:hypothetical protein